MQIYIFFNYILKMKKNNIKSFFFITFALCGSSSVGRALASQAKSRGFESRFPLKF